MISQPLCFPQLLSLFLGIRPRCPDLLQHTWSHSCWQTGKLKAFPAGSQEHMIIQLSDVHSCHGCRVIETKDLRPPAHTCVCAGSPQEAVSQFLGTKTTCHDLCSTCICVCACAGKSQMPTEPLKQNFLTCRTHSCALATAYQHKTQSSHFNFNTSLTGSGRSAKAS